MRGDLPDNDAFDLALRYRVTAARAPASKPFAGEANIGDTRQFAVVVLTSAALSSRTPPDVVTVDATLMARSAHAYFFEDAALQADPAAVQTAADMFEASTWPTVTGVFGTPATPGVDGDPRIIVLQSSLGGAGGYFSTDDVYLKALRPLSNEAEMVYIDRTLRPGTAGFNVVLAHELQHLIHQENDPSEESWTNEGLSETASGLVGGAVSSVNSFGARPDTQLNDWDINGSAAHYGAGAAFYRYLASRFGGDPSLGVIARGRRDGQAGVDDFLASIGSSLRFRDVFADWIAANYLNEDSGPYGNPEQPVQLRIDDDLAVGGTPAAGEAHEFGTDYYGLSGLGGGELTLAFKGQSETNVISTTAPDGHPFLWGNAKESIDTKLTREVDLTRATDPVLTFRTWYDIERWYDWGYVSVSTDGGATWTALAGDQTTDDDPVHAAYGPGYSGVSGGGPEAAWVDERVSLAPFVGKKILLRFEYVTDGGTHREGWAIEDIRIDAVGFRDDDGTAPGWTSEGWVRIDRTLPQTYVVRLIEKMTDGTSHVLDVPLDPTQRGELQFSPAGIEDAVVAVAGTTEGTNLTAPYTLELRRP